ncbi:hypothetical protein [Verrucomicrobium sp. BvORR034]|uniref:hypothetical protein n=1 Tax=Verrucomicrobium sp. BvORR034 TaxID=1396418 RepID=UPI00067852E3|nr:hypothetical protein [Verrucomicrobium sp. BvORR034]
MQFKGLLEALPDLEFFIKDKEGRFVAASNATRQRLGIQAEEDIVGRLDVDVHPAPASTQRKSGHFTTRLPLFSNDGQVVGNPVFTVVVSAVCAAGAKW